MRFRVMVSAAALAMALGTMAVAQDGGEAVSQPVAAAQGAPISAFGSLPAYEFVEVSPSGDRIAYVTVVGEERALLIFNLADMANPIGGMRVGGVKVRGVDWLGEDKVVVVTSAAQSAAAYGLSRTELSEAQIYDIPTKVVRSALNQTPGVFPKVFAGPYIRTIDGRPSLIIGAAATQSPYGLGLYRINLDTGEGRKFEDPEPSARSYLMSGEGVADVRSDYEERTNKWQLQVKRGGFWRTVWSDDQTLEGPNLVGYGRTPGTAVIYGQPDNRENGYHEINLETGEFSDLPWDDEPAAFIPHPVTRLLAGAVFSDVEGTRYEFNDPAMARIWRSVRAAFPDKRIDLVSFSNDLRQVVIQTEGAGDPGTYQFVDFDTGSAGTVGTTYALTPEQIGELRVVTYKAADGMDIPAYLTLPPGVTDPKGLALVVLAHGGPAARDYPTFDWWAQGIASRGYAVLQPQFRGSDGFGQEHLEAGYGEWGRKMQTDLSDGVRYLAEQGIIDPAKVCIMGASYGGYAAMAGPTLDPGVYRCAVAVAGVSDLRRMVEWSAEKVGERDSTVVEYWNRFMGAERLGDRTLDERSPARQAGRADAPILMLHGWQDTVVPYEQSNRMADALKAAGKPYELIRLEGEDHWLSGAETRQRMLSESVRFLEAHNPPH